MAKEKVTEIVFVLDRSGSMGGLETDVIGGFNSFLSEQQKLKGKARLTTILFDDRYEVLHDGVDIKDVQPITKAEYFVRGSTALLDAVGKAITTTRSHTNKKDKVLVIINTDGYENSSREYDNEKLKKLVKECEDEDKWKFIFIGANMDSFAVGGAFGVTTTANYTNTGTGVRSVYNSVTTVTSSYRSSSTDALDTSALDDIK